ncbi:hypothetical protein [Nakamurella endophytica]|uniref:Uncharacterized protein n=1 Tax=Nakamurella endophytica TaxID=1748367 RepID=A0A917SLY7_9ACTN|nr:hypothetical protein [Nakamurella endophytica]GGL86941.1 hypothetical protein GCM10011594_03200 [Nakamurella endophytica]
MSGPSDARTAARTRRWLAWSLAAVALTGGVLVAGPGGTVTPVRAAPAPAATGAATGAAAPGAAGTGAVGTAAAVTGAAATGAAVTGAVAEAAAAPASTASGPVRLLVDPATALDPAGARITVSGSGYNAGVPLLVAVCAAGGSSLDDCVGGPVPAGNGSTAWAYVTGDGAAPPDGGGVRARFGPGGAFSVQLRLPAVGSGPGPDCTTARCAVVTRPATGGDDGALSVPVSFAGGPTTGPTTASTTRTTTASSTSTTTTTSTATSTTESSTTSSSTETSSPPPTSISTRPAPSTLAAKTIRADTIAAGAQQQVAFLGFDPGEKVTVLLFSDPIPLPSRTVDQSGFVVIDFTVPADLAPGTHVLQVTGARSRNVGIARFEVTAPPATTTSSTAPAPTPTASPTPSSTPTTSTPASSSAPVSTAASSAAPPIPAPAAPTNTRPVWPWFVLGGLVLLLAGFGIFIWGQRRRRLDEEQERERTLAAAAAEEHQRAVRALRDANADAPTTQLGPYGHPEPPPFGADPGLLSGRDDPYNPPLLSGRQPYPSPGGSPGDAPTFRPGSEPARPPLSPEGDPGSGPGTEQWRPDWAEGSGRRAQPGPDEGPSTQQWRPDDEGQQQWRPDDGGPSTQQWRPDDDDPSGPPRR